MLHMHGKVKKRPTVSALLEAVLFRVHIAMAHRTAQSVSALSRASPHHRARQLPLGRGDHAKARYAAAMQQQQLDARRFDQEAARKWWWRWFVVGVVQLCQREQMRSTQTRKTQRVLFDLQVSRLDFRANFLFVYPELERRLILILKQLEIK